MSSTTDAGNKQGLGIYSSPSEYPRTDSNGSEVEYLLGIHDFKGRSDDELSLKKGDHIQVIETDKEYGDGWYIGRNLTTNEAGLFPKVFTTTLILPNARRVMSRNNSTVSKRSYFSPASPSPQQQQQPPLPLPKLSNTSSVHDTLTDIDEAIYEISGQTQPQSPPLQHNQQSSPQRQSQQQDSNSRISAQSGGSTSSIDFRALQSLPGMPSFENVLDWSPYEVQHYFEARGYDPSVCEQFIHHKITGSILLELELAYLKEIDITSFGTRFEISKDIKYLNQIVNRQQQQQQRAESNESSPVLPSPASVRRQSMSHEYTRANSRSSMSNGPAVGTRSSSLRGSGEQQEFSTMTSETSRPQSQRQPSIGRNSPGLRSRSSSSVNSTDQGFSNNSSATHLALNDSTTIPEHEPTVESRGSVSSSGGGRQRSNSARKSSYVEDSRRRLHSRDGSFDTIRAAAKSITQENTAATQDDENDTTFYQSPRQSRSANTFLRKRHSHSGSGSNLEVDFDDATSKQHKRRSSLLSALMGNGGGLGSQPSSPQQGNSEDGAAATYGENYGQYYPSPLDEDYDDDSGATTEESSPAPSSGQQQQQVQFSHEKKSSMPEEENKKPNRSLRQASSTHNLRRGLTKQKTSAFLEGIRQVNAEKAAQTADFSGWMHKRGGISVGAWKSRYFTLHGTRLSYFSSFNDDKERGLIDITAHRVLPAKENEDKLVTFYAASVGAGRHVFKLTPPAPGSKKGVTFTAPKVHYFAVETRQEMREWMAALMKATIDRDETVPVLSSCATPTVTLPKAQELFAEARERDEDLRSKMIAGGLSNMPNANAAAAAAAAKQQAANNTMNGSNNNGNGNGNGVNNSDPESPGSSLRSSRTGSSATNSSSLKVVSSSTSPKDFALNGGGNGTNQPTDLRHLTAKTAGLKIVTDLERE